MKQIWKMQSLKNVQCVTNQITATERYEMKKPNMSTLDKMVDKHCRYEGFPFSY